VINLLNILPSGIVIKKTTPHIIKSTIIEQNEASTNTVISYHWKKNWTTAMEQTLSKTF
jgi:hypothetical protein